MAELEYNELFGKDLTKKIEDLQQAIIDLSDAIDKRLVNSIKELEEESKDLSKQLDKTEASTEDGQKAIVDYSKATQKLIEESKQAEQAQKAYNKQTEVAVGTVKELKVQAQELKTRYDNLNLATEEGRIEGEKLAEQYRVINDQVKKSTSALRKNTAVVRDAEGSYNALVKEQKDLREQLRRMPDAFNKTNDAANELKKRINDNTQALKRFDKELGDNFRNVGNYAEALREAGKEAKVFSGNLGATAVSKTISGISSALDTNADAAEAANAVTGSLQATFGEFVGTIVRAIKASESTFDFFEKLGEEFEGFDDRVVEATKAATEAASENRELNEAIKEATLTLSKQIVAFEENQAIADADTKSIEERTIAAKKAEILGKAILQQEVDLAQARLDLAAANAKAQPSNAQFQQDLADATLALEESKAALKAGSIELEAFTGLLKLDQTEQFFDFKIVEIEESIESLVKTVNNAKKATDGKSFLENFIGGNIAEISNTFKIGDQLALTALQGSEVLVKFREEGAKSALEYLNSLGQTERQINLIIQLLEKWNDATKEITENSKIQGEQVKQAIQDATFNISSDVGNFLFGRTQQQIDEQLAREQALLDFRLEAAGNNAEAQAIIAEEGERKERELLQRRAETEKKQALFNIALNTAAAIVAQLVAPPPVNFAAAAAVAAIGAVQLAIAASQPIPQFAEGTEDAPGGLAWVGEKGPELIDTPDGKTYLSPGVPTLIDLPKHSEVKTAKETEEALSAFSYGARQLIEPQVIYDGIEREDLIKHGDKLAQAFSSQVQHVTQINKRGLETFIKYKNNKTEYYNKRYA